MHASTTETFGHWTFLVPHTINNPFWHCREKHWWIIRIFFIRKRRLLSSQLNYKIRTVMHRLPSNVHVCYLASTIMRIPSWNWIWMQHKYYTHCSTGTSDPAHPPHWNNRSQHIPHKQHRCEEHHFYLFSRSIFSLNPKYNTQSQYYTHTATSLQPQNYNISNSCEYFTELTDDITLENSTMYGCELTSINAC